MMTGRSWLQGASIVAGGLVEQHFVLFTFWREKAGQLGAFYANQVRAVCI
jgi:hypothetical protein